MKSLSDQIYKTIIYVFNIIDVEIAITIKDGLVSHYFVLPRIAHEDADYNTKNKSLW